MKTHIMKIYEGGKLIEVVKRQEVEWIGKPRKSIVRPITVTHRNGLGSNQYQTKRRTARSRRSMRNEIPQWKKTLFAGMIMILIVGGIGRAWKVYAEPKIDSFFAKAEAHEKEAGQSGEIKLISPLPDPTETPATQSSEPNPIPAEAIKENRAKMLHSFLVEKKSPLADHAEFIVAMADKHDIPWTLVTAISGKESSFETAGDTTDFNAWGIMTWDKAGNRSIRKFESWEASIEYASKLISENYRHNMNQAIQAKYCPSFECSETWVRDVTSFQEAINE